MTLLDRIKNNEIMKKVGLILGPTAAITMFLIPELPGLVPEGKQFLGLLLWVVIWWATGPVHYSITSLIPIFGLPLFPYPSIGIKTFFSHKPLQIKENPLLYI